MLTMWVRSVSTVTCSFSAMSLLARPSPRAVSTCFSRGVSFSIALLVSYSSWRLRLLTMRSISTTSAGESRASPDLRRRTASTISSIGGGLVEHPGGACLDGPGEPVRFEAGAQDQRHHVGTGRELLDEPEPVTVRQREVNDGDVEGVGSLAQEGARLGQRARLAGHGELPLPREHEG